MQKLFDKYRLKIVEHTLGEQDIISLRSALNAGKFNGSVDVFDRRRA